MRRVFYSDAMGHSLLSIITTHLIIKGPYLTLVKVADTTLYYSSDYLFLLRCPRPHPPLCKTQICTIIGYRTKVILQRIIFSFCLNFFILTLWLPGRNACQDPDILVWEFYFSSFEAGIANAISSFKWRKIHKCSIYLTKICVILWLRSLTNDDGNFRHVW